MKAATGFLQSRVVQVHPTLRCNLSCSHCYSRSGPDATGEIPPEILIDMLARLASEGYEVVSFSGGEPLIYRGFGEVARAAKHLGYRVNLITNGLMLNARWLDELAGVISLVGISIDGSERIHDRIRGAGTFNRTTRRIASLRDRGFTFGIAHCVTRESIADIPWLLEFCLEQGASLLQLHPIAAEGRVADDDGRRLLGPDTARLYLLAQLLEIQAGGALKIQLDLVPTVHVLGGRDQFRVLSDRPGSERLPLSELVNPLVLDEGGCLWPLAYGMAASQRITAEAPDGWTRAFEVYARSGALPLKRLLSSALSKLEGQEGFIDWYAYLVEHSHTLDARTL